MEIEEDSALPLSSRIERVAKLVVADREDAVPATVGAYREPAAGNPLSAHQNRCQNCSALGHPEDATAHLAKLLFLPGFGHCLGTKATLETNGLSQKALPRSMRLRFRPQSGLTRKQMRRRGDPDCLRRSWRAAGTCSVRGKGETTAAGGPNSSPNSASAPAGSCVRRRLLVIAAGRARAAGGALTSSRPAFGDFAEEELFSPPEGEGDAPQVSPGEASTSPNTTVERT